MWVLVQGASNIALVGAVAYNLVPEYFGALSLLGALAPGARCL